MNKYPLVSVIIPSHGRPIKTRSAVKSVLAQSYPNVEIIVIDDNGEYSAHQVETKASLKYFIDACVITYISHQKNSGAAIARNTGIKHARGELVAFLDSDDEWMPEKLEAQVLEYIKSKNKNIGFVYCEEIHVNGDREFVRNESPRKNPLEQQLENTIATTSSLMIPKKVLKKVGGFNRLPSSQEAELLLRILSRGFIPIFVSRPLVRRDVSDFERISNSVHAYDNTWLQVRTPYLPLASKVVRKKVYRNHYINKANHAFQSGKKFYAFKNLIRAILSYPWCVRNYLHFIRFFIPHDLGYKLYSTFLMLHKRKMAK